MKASQTGDEFRVGDRLFIFGGYYPEPKWLAGGTGYEGKLIAFMPGQNDKPAALVETDRFVTCDGMTGKYLVLELGWVGAMWREPVYRVHVELCDFVPESRTWSERRQGKWVESHASCKKL